MNKPRKIFIDVGTHDGQTLEEVTKEKYGFDFILGFEPMIEQYKNVSEKFSENKKVKIFNIALSNKTAESFIYGDNKNMGSSLLPNKKDIDNSVKQICKTFRVSHFFNTCILESDTVFMKLNCEGSEIDILNDLIDTKEIFKIHNVMIDFDIRKCEGMEGMEGMVIEKKKKIQFKGYSLCDDVMIGNTHQERIANWLNIVSKVI